MQNQKGFTVVEFLVVVVITCIIAVIAIPSLMRASVNMRTMPFSDAFGIELPITFATRKAPLGDEVKRRLRPYVQARLAELCAPDTIEQAGSVDPLTVQRRINDLANRLEKCAAARKVAQSEDLLPAQTP